MQAVRVMNLRDVDELLFLDIAATPEKRRPDFAQIDDIADNCFMPLTVGGGVTSLEDVRALLAVGADKVTINTAALAEPELLRAASREFGAQCIVAAIDVVERDGRRFVSSECGRRATDIDPITWAIRCADLGAGEIIVTSVARDGTLNGLDIVLVSDIAEAVQIPVVAAGGAGSSTDFIAAIRAGAAGVAAGALFQFTESTPVQVRNEMRAAGIPVRASKSNV